jgi:hypothetical protein
VRGTLRFDEYYQAGSFRSTVVSAKLDQYVGSKQKKNIVMITMHFAAVLAVGDRDL